MQYHLGLLVLNASLNKYFWLITCNIMYDGPFYVVKLFLLLSTFICVLYASLGNKISELGKSLKDNLSVWTHIMLTVDVSHVRPVFLNMLSPHMSSDLHIMCRPFILFNLLMFFSKDTTPVRELGSHIHLKSSARHMSHLILMIC